jgi:hypothetical protein
MYMTLSETGPLSPEQQDALTTAHEEGYWDVPRGISQGELADPVGIGCVQYPVTELLLRRLRETLRDAVTR